MRLFTGLISALTLAVAISASAQSASSLKDNMKEIGGLFKGIFKTMGDKFQNAKNAESASQLVAIFKAAQSEVPDSIKALPADKQGAAIADFQATMQKEIDGAAALAAAFKADDNSKANALVQAMNNTKKDAHTKFDPQN